MSAFSLAIKTKGREKAFMIFFAFGLTETFQESAL